MLIHFDSSYLQPDTSFNEAVSKALILHPLYYGMT